jgi:Flp pilus assembly protein TadG
MMRLSNLPAALRQDERGAMLIETAIVAPVLILLSMGAFQISQVVARQSELQGAAAEALSIAIAAPPKTAQERAILKNVIVASTGLATNQVTVTDQYRCGSATTYVNASTDCIDTKVSSYVHIRLSDTYTPAWTQWGFGSPITYNVSRYVMISQS